MGPFLVLTRFTLLCSLGILATTFGLTPNDSFRGRSIYKHEYKGPYSGLSMANGDYTRQSTGTKLSERKMQKGGLGLSAWGIVAVLSGALFLGTVLYYAVLFYPILCKKERKSQNDSTIDCCPTAPPVDNITGLSTPV